MRRVMPRYRSVRLATLVSLLTVLLGIVAPGLHADERSAIVRKKLSEGEYLQYLPKHPPRGILVIAHGSTEGDEAMTSIAPEGKSGVRLMTVPGVGHSSSRLTPACQSALAQQLGTPEARR